MATDNLMPQNTTSKIKQFMLRSSTTGLGLTGKGAADFTGKYNIAGGAEVPLSFSGGSPGDAYISGKIVPLGLGKYAWHVPDVLFQTLGDVLAVLAVTGAIDEKFSWEVVADDRMLATKPVNVTQFGGSAGTFSGGRPEVRTASIATDAVDAASVKADAVTKIQAGLATPTNITAATGVVLAGVTHTGAVIPTVTTVTNQLSAAAIANEVQTRTIARVTLVDTCTANSDMRGTDNAALAATALSTAVWTTTIAGRIDADISSRATPGDVSPTINFSPTIEPTELSAGSVSAIQSGLALESSVQSVITTLSEGVELDSATLQKIDQILEDTSTTLPGLIGDIEGGGAGLTGPYTRTITVTDADTDEPIEAAKVRLYRTGETGTEATDEDGIALFTVEAATWSYGVTASGYTGVSGSVVVSANGDTPIALTPNSITPPSNPSLSAIVVLCLDAAGQPEPDVDIDIRIVTVPSGSQNIAYKGAKQTATSDDDGIARFEVVQGSVCEWKRGRADVWSRVTIDSDSVTNVTSVIGSP
jgi:hypothetical protein